MLQDDPEHKVQNGSDCYQMTYIVFTLAPARCSQTRARQRGRGQYVEVPMNVLSMIKDRQIKAQRRFEAELMMAKAYRGVAYVDVHHDTPMLSSPASARIAGRTTHLLLRFRGLHRSADAIPCAQC